MAALVTSKTLIDNVYTGAPGYDSTGSPFGRASTAVLEDGTFLVGQPTEADQYGDAWIMRIWHLDASLNILGEVSQDMGAMARAVMIPTSGQKAIIVLNQPRSTAYARWNVEATGAPRSSATCSHSRGRLTGTTTSVCRTTAALWSWRTTPRPTSRSSPTRCS
jgi:hypothetical protein